MAGRARERPSSLAMLDSPSLDARLAAGGERNLLDEGDDSGFMNLTSKDLDRLNLVDTPPVRRIEKKAQAHVSSPSKSILTKRPSWGPKSSPMKAKMRLLEGVDDPGNASRPQVKRKERTLGGLGQNNGGTLRPRQSIFVKPAFHQNRQEEAPERTGNVEKDEEGEDSFYKDPGLSSSTSSLVKGRVAAIEANRAQAEANQIPHSNGTESREQMDSQLSELKKMNGVFEAYERMLTGSADQIENFAQRIEETNSLLDIYIDLMRQADRTQQLLLDTDWKGATADETAHNLALELAERERKRKQEEEEQAAREAVNRKKEAERARLEAQKVEQKRPAGTGTRGARVGGASMVRGAAPSARGRGASSTTSRVPSATRGKTVSTTASTRGTTAASRGAGTTNGLNNQYADVRSSGYGPSR